MSPFYSSPSTDSPLYPAWGSPLGGSIVRVEGSNFRRGALCRFGSVVVRAAYYFNSTSLQCVAPPFSTAGGAKYPARHQKSRVLTGTSVSVEVSIDGGKEWSDTQIQFHYQEDLVLKALEPAFGSEDGNDSVVLTASAGVFMRLPTFKLKWGSQFVSYVRLSDTELLIKTPPHVPGTVVVQATNNGIDFSAPLLFGYHGYRIHIQKVEPTVLYNRGSNHYITITGSGFGRDPVACATRNRTYNPVAVSDTTVVCQAPYERDLVSNVPFGIRILSPWHSNVDYVNFQLNYVLEPNITRIFPNYGSREGGTTITVEGTGFLQHKTECIFNGTTRVTAIYKSAQTILCVVPAAPEKRVGEIDVTIVTDSINYQHRHHNRSSAAFHYIQPFSIDSILPTEVPVGVPSQITVMGDHFYEISHLGCRFGYQSEHVVAEWLSPTQIRCNYTATKPGSVQIFATLNGVDYVRGDASLRIIEKLPYVASISPQRINSYGGELLTIEGSMFENSEALMCEFDSSPVIRVRATYISENKLRCRAPSSFNNVATTVRKVRVSNNGRLWSSTFANSLSFVYHPLIVISALEPAYGSMDGNNVVTVTGSHFTRDLKCAWSVDGGSQQIYDPMHYFNSTALLCRAPRVNATSSTAQLVTSQVDLLWNGRIATAYPLRYGYVANPKITKIIPNFAYMTYDAAEAAATTVHVEVIGTNFLNSDVLKCSFGKESIVPANYINSTRVSCDIPASYIPKAKLLRVTGDLVNYGDEGLLFEFLPFATLNAISPSTIPIKRSQRVTLRGGALRSTPLLHCKWAIGSGKFSYFPATVIDQSTVSCEAPWMASAATISVMLVDGDKRITNHTVSLSYYTLPSVATVSPHLIEARAGAKITITGQGFTGMPGGTQCKVNGTFTQAIVRSSTVAECELPANTDVHGHFTDAVITDRDGNYLGAQVRIMHIATPSLSYVVPAVGFQGVTVTLTGTSFTETGDLKCWFGRTAVQATVTGNTTATCVVPSKTPGRSFLRLTNNNADFSRPLPFTIENKPSINGIFPTSVRAIGRSEVTITGNLFKPGNPTRCKFGSKFINATVVNTTHITCVTPPLNGNMPNSAFQVVNIGVEIDSLMVIGSLTLTFEPVPVLISISPPSGPPSGGTIVQVTGKRLTTVSHCRFGSKLVHAIVKSPTLLLCVAPSFETPKDNITANVTDSPFTNYKVTIDVTTNNGYEFTKDGPVFRYTEYVGEEDVKLSHLDPSWGFELQNTTVRVFAKTGYFLPWQKTMCQFGIMTPTPARWLSQVCVECQAPSHIVGEVKVRISNDGLRYSSSLDFSYVSRNILVNAKSPYAETTQQVVAHWDGGMEVIVQGNVFHEHQKLLCRFGNFTFVNATRVNQTSLRCILPQHMSPGSYEVHVIDAEWHDDMTAHDYDNNPSAGVQILVSDGPTVTAVQPFMVPLNLSRTITVTGDYFFNDRLMCEWTDSEGVQTNTTATYLTPQSLTCDCPAKSKEGAVVLEVWTQGIRHSHDQIQLQYKRINVTAVYPRLGSVTGNTMVTVTGSGFVNTPKLHCKFGPYIASQTTWVEDYKIICRTPYFIAYKNHAADFVPVSVTFNDEDYVAGTAEYMYHLDMFVLDWYPKTGPAHGDTTVTIYGDNFVNSSSLHCLFGSKIAYATFRTKTTITCQSPQHSAGSYDVKVSANYLDTYGLAGGAVKYVYYTDPEVYGVHPKMGTWLGGTNVTVTGANFVNSGAHCRFYHVEEWPENDLWRPPHWLETNATVWSPNELTCESPVPQPEKARFAVEVSFNHQDFTKDGVVYTFTEPIHITDIFPKDGETVGGVHVTIVGSGFDGNFSNMRYYDDVPFRNNASCWFGSYEVPATVYNRTCMLCTAPAQAVGSYNVEVSLYQNNITTDRNVSFFYYPTPIVYKVFPTYVSTKGNMHVTIFGANFRPRQTDFWCSVGSHERVEVVFINDTTALCRIPPHGAGLTKIGVTANDRDYHKLNLTYYDEPHVHKFFPESVPAGATTEIMVYGEGFIDFAGVVPNWRPYCKFGDIIVPSVVRNSTVMTCNAPSRKNVSKVNLEVSIDGSNYTFDRVPFRFSRNIVIDYIKYNRGPVSGGSRMEIHGEFFLDYMAQTYLLVNFNGSQPTPARFVDGHRIDVILPPSLTGPGAKVVEVSLNTLDYTNQGKLFFYEDPMYITSILPPLGPQMGSTIVALYGSGFTNVPSLECKFGDTKTPVHRYIDNTWIECIAPASATVGPVEISVSSNDYQNRSSPQQYTYYSEVHVTSIYPIRASTGGSTLITVTGSGFVNHPLLSCLFDDAVVPGVYVSPTEVHCTSPNHPAAMVALEISNNNQTYTNNGIQFEYYLKERGYYTHPKVAAIGGTTWIYITGDNFVEHDDLSCRFGGSSGMEVFAEYLNQSSIRCKAPAYSFLSGFGTLTHSDYNFEGSAFPAMGSYDLEVSNNRYHYYQEEIFGKVTYTAIPTVMAVSPNETYSDLQRYVFVYGAGFANVSTLSCRFKGTYVTNATWLSQNLVYCEVPDWKIRGENVHVQISNNLQDYSVDNVRLLLKDPQPFEYKNHMTYDPIPSGTFNEDSLAAPNVTLCPPGSYMPTGRNSSCRLCPRGTVCPRAGMHTPLPCPSGFTCHLAGTIYAKHPCPQGHYCPEGTETFVSTISHRPRDYRYGRVRTRGFDTELYAKQTNEWYFVNASMPFMQKKFFLNQIGLGPHPRDYLRDGPELWTNWSIGVPGAPTAPVLLRDIHASSGSNVTFWTSLGDKIIFTATDGTQWGLFVSGGTVASTKDLEWFVTEPTFLTIHKGSVLFAGDNGQGSGREVWSTRGTLATTVLLVDINNGAGGSDPKYLTTFHDTIYLSANDGVYGQELWMTNGSAAGTFLVADIEPGSGSSNPDFITATHDVYMFFRTDGAVTTGSRVHWLKWNPNHRAILGPIKILDLDGVISDLEWIRNLDFCRYTNCMGEVGHRHSYKEGLHSRVYVTDATQTRLWEMDGTNDGSREIVNLPLPCPAGYYCTEGVSFANTTRAPDLTDNSTYPRWDGARGITAFAQKCWDGYMCNPGSRTPRGDGPCPKGWYCPTGMLPQKCPRDYFCPMGGKEPLMCPPGTYNEFEEMSICTICPLGYYCPHYMTTLPFICPPGRICADWGRAQPAMCPPGHYCLKGTTTWNRTTHLAKDSDLALYVPLYNNLKHRGMYPCPNGTFCVGGTETNVTIEGNYTTPQQCSQGYYCQINANNTVGAMTPTGTAICPGGYYCPRGTTNPILTDSGWYSPPGSNHPHECLPGTYSPRPGMPECLSCDLGSECRYEKTVVPTPCGKAEWRSGNHIRCQKCPGGTWSNLSALAYPSDCYNCSEGWMCVTDGRTEPPQLDPANLCQPGYVCKERSDARTFSDQQCPGGYMCGPGTTPSMQYDMPCKAGYYCPSGSSPYSSKFNVCPRGYFCPNKTEDYPGNLGMKYKCDRGTTSKPGSSHVDHCKKTCSFCTTPCECEVIAKTVPMVGILNDDWTKTIDAASTIDLDCNFTFLNNYDNLTARMNWTEHFEIVIRADDTLKYGRDMDKQEFPIYFNRNMTSKKDAFRIRLLAEKRIEVSIHLEMYHGRFERYIGLFTDVCKIDVREPSRAIAGTQAQFVALLYKSEMYGRFTYPIKLPLNILENSDVIAMVDTGTKDANMTYLYNDSYVPHQQRYWKNAKTDEILTMTYLPYFSSCVGFDSHIPISYFTEHPDYCKLVDSPTIVGPFDWFQEPVADTCVHKTQCRIEEKLEGDSKHFRWFDVPEDTILFHIGAVPVEPGVYRQEYSHFTSILETDDLIPVRVVENTNNFGKKFAVPTEVVIEIGYYQITETEKQVVFGEISLLNFTAVPGLPKYDAGKVNDSILNNVEYGYYKLTVKWTPLTWIDLINNFTYEAPVFLVLFFLVVFVAVSYAIVLYFTVRKLSTMIKKPNFRFGFFAMTLLEGPVTGLTMVLVPAMAGLGVCYTIAAGFNPYSNLQGDFLEGGLLSSDEVKQTSFGRFGLMQLCVGLVMINYTAILMVPWMKPLMSQQTDMWNPSTWKRAFVFFFNTLLGVSLVWLLEFAYSEFFGSNAIAIVVLLTFVEEFAMHVIETVIGEALLMVPGKMAVFTALMIATMGADTFEDFATSFLLEIVIGMTMKVFLDPQLAKLSLTFPIAVKKVQLWIYKKRGLHFMTQNVMSDIQDLCDEMEAQHIEPMVENYSEYCAEVLGCFLTPVIILLIYLFAEETRIPTNFGIRQQDILYYFIFAVFVAIGEVIMNVFVFQALEILYGWPIFDYVEYAQHRFRTRKMRWRGHEHSLDETLSPPLQSIDNLCFSSQYYFVTSLGGVGICYLMIGMTIMLRAEYSPLNDYIAPALCLFVAFSALTLMTAVVKLAEKWEIWEPRHRYKIEGESELERINAEKRAKKEMMYVREGKLPRGALTRMMAKNQFIKYNQPWIFENLPYILTRKLLKQNRPFLTRAYHKLVEDGKLAQCRFDISSDSDADEANFMTGTFNVSHASPITKGVMLFWLAKARQIRKFKYLVKSVDVSRKRLACLRCGSKHGLMVEQLTEFESLMIAFNNERAEGFPGWPKDILDMPESDQWRQYYDANGRFRTLCRVCRISKQSKKPQAEVSVDSSEFESDGVDVVVEDGTIQRKLLDMWLYVSRRRMGYGHIPRLTLKKIPRTRGTATAKPVQILQPVRDDISSDSEASEVEIVQKHEVARVNPADISDDSTDSDALRECIFTKKEINIIGKWLQHMKKEAMQHGR
eukprot:jgi/Bigna1/127040/aug1.3_g1748